MRNPNLHISFSSTKTT